MSREPIDRDPFEPDSDPLLRERAGQWLGEGGRHLREAELARVAERSGAALEHLLQCDECAMRVSTQLDLRAARGKLRVAPRRPGRWAAGIAAATALLLLALLPGTLRGPAATGAVEASLLHDPAALRGSETGSTITLSHVQDGQLSVLLSVESAASRLDWEVQRPLDDVLRGTLEFPPGAPDFKEFVLRLRLRELIGRESGELTLRVRDPGGEILGQWPLRVRP